VKHTSKIVTYLLYVLEGKTSCVSTHKYHCKIKYSHTRLISKTNLLIAVVR